MYTVVLLIDIRKTFNSFSKALKDYPFVLQLHFNRDHVNTI